MSRPTGGAERRAVARRPCQSSSCRLLGGAAWEARIHDISPLGVGLLCEGPAQPGEWLDLRLSGQGSALGLALRVRVVHAVALPDGRWLVGCAFDAPLPDALADLIQ
jgi:hypothetical protein